MKPKSTLRTFLVLAGSSLLAVSSASAVDYYWDADGANPGFTATQTGTTWDAAGTGNLWSTDSTGSSATAAIATTTSDDVYFGTLASPASGNVATSGTVNANKITLTNGGFATTGQTFNFSNAGTLERLVNDNGSMPTSTTFTFDGDSNTSSITWKPRRNFNVSNVTHSASKVILSTSSDTDHVYPGRTVMNQSGNLGAAGAELVFNDGQLRLNSGFPYTNLAALDTDHPVTFTADEDAGFENLNTGNTWTIDLDVDLGTGAIWLAGNSGGRDIILTATGSTWGKVYLVGGTLEVSDSSNLGPISAPFSFGTGPTVELNGGTLRITGTTFSSFGARTVLLTDGKGVGFEIVEAAHTFTLDQALTMGAGGLTKTGDGTLALSGTANTYTGATDVSAGTLDLVGGSSLDSPVTVSSGAHLGLSLNTGTPATALATSTSTVDLTNGDVTITNPGGVDNSSDYLLMTATGGFTVTDPVTQLGTAVPDYELALQNSNTELWLVYAPSGSAYDTWATGSEPFDGDANGDGVMDGLAFLLGAATPATDATGLLPTVTEDGSGGLVLTFNCLPTGSRGTSVLKVEHSSDLGISDAWAAAEVPDADGVDNGVSFVVGVGPVGPPALNSVTATIPISEAVGGKLFGRLKAENP